jgi:hypothetical protein
MVFLVFFLITNPPQPTDYVRNAGGYVGIMIFSTVFSLLVEIGIYAFDMLTKSEVIRSIIVTILRKLFA